MPSSHPPPIVSLPLPPPGLAVHDLRILPTGQISYSPSSTHPPPPQLFRDALVVRAAVFVLEQKCSAAEEIDADDGVSWHIVIYAEDETEEESTDEEPESASSDEADTIEGDRSAEKSGEEEELIGGGRPAEDSGAEDDPIEIPAATIRLVPAQAHADVDDDGAVEGPDYKGSRVWDHREPYVKIGRLATVAACRGRGYGKMLVNAALGFAGRNEGKMVRDIGLGAWNGLVLAHAQKSVEGWYKSLGFELDEGMGRWWEEGIEHIGMWIRVELRK